MRTSVALVAVLALAGCVPNGGDTAPTQASVTRSATPVPHGTRTAPATTTGQSRATTTEAHRASSWPVPNRSLTPGAVAAGCTYPRPTSQRSVTSAEKAAVAARYHYAGPTGLTHVEYDHLVPFALCGSNGIANLWPEPADDAPLSTYVHNRKDQLEGKVASMVRHHHLTLQQAQHLFLATDWRHLWCLYVHVTNDGVTCDV
jgi:hypothetical protein